MQGNLFYIRIFIIDIPQQRTVGISKSFVWLF